jgi:hypothetical protein
MECDFDTHKCDFDTNDCGFYTQSHQSFHPILSYKFDDELFNAFERFQNLKRFFLGDGGGFAPIFSEGGTSKGPKSPQTGCNFFVEVICVEFSSQIMNKVS